MFYYRGLYPLLNKWMEKGFNHDVRQLQLFMESGNVQLAKQKVFTYLMYL